MGPSPTLQSKSELFWYCQSSALASQIVTLRSNFAVWQDTGRRVNSSPKQLFPAHFLISRGRQAGGLRSNIFARPLEVPLPHCVPRKHQWQGCAHLSRTKPEPRHPSARLALLPLSRVADGHGRGLAAKGRGPSAADCPQDQAEARERGRVVKDTSIPLVYGATPPVPPCGRPPVCWPWIVCVVWSAAEQVSAG